jgi:hypothetical protein
MVFFECGAERPFYLEAQQNVKVIRKKLRKSSNSLLLAAKSRRQRNDDEAENSRKPRRSLLLSFERLARFLIQDSYRAFIGGFHFLV